MASAIAAAETKTLMIYAAIAERHHTLSHYTHSRS